MEGLQGLFNKKGVMENHKLKNKNKNFKQNFDAFIDEKFEETNNKLYKGGKKCALLTINEQIDIWNGFFNDCLTFIAHNLVSKTISFEVNYIPINNAGTVLRGRTGWMADYLNYMNYDVVIRENNKTLASFQVDTMFHCCGALEISDFECYIDELEPSDREEFKKLKKVFKNIFKYMFLKENAFLTHVTSDTNINLCQEIFNTKGKSLGRNPKSGNELFMLTLRRDEVYEE